MHHFRTVSRIKILDLTKESIGGFFGVNNSLCIFINCLLKHYSRVVFSLPKLLLSLAAQLRLIILYHRLPF